MDQLIGFGPVSENTFTVSLEPYFFSIVQHGLGVETERVPRVETERAMLGPLYL